MIFMNSKRLTFEEFTLQAIKNLRTEKSKGIHVVYSGFNKAFKEYFGEDSRNIVDQLIDKGIIEKKPVKGGIMIYIKGEGPKFKEPDDALSKILGD
tara:strand:+ start:147 stop:434 length:288 start_codon:yes stop_codon:yes gene_type:complete